MTETPAVPLIVRHVTLKDQPTHTGPVLRPDGYLGVFCRGVGLDVGPLSPSDLRQFANAAFCIAAQLEERADHAAATAADQLAAIVAEGSEHD